MVMATPETSKKKCLDIMNFYVPLVFTLCVQFILFFHCPWWAVTNGKIGGIVPSSVQLLQESELKCFVDICSLGKHDYMVLITFSKSWPQHHILSIYQPVGTFSGNALYPS